MWKVLQRVHQEKPYHLFFLGGDQVYADQVWENVPALRDWLSKKLKKRLPAPFTPDMEQQVSSFTFDLYCQYVEPETTRCHSEPDSYPDDVGRPRYF